MSNSYINDLTFDYRRSISKFASGIAIISTDSSDIINSTPAVNLIPICFSPATLIVPLHNGKILHQITKQKNFGVSILSDTQKNFSEEINNQPYNNSFSSEFTIRNYTPTLNNCLSWFECKATRFIIHKNQTLVFGEVNNCGTTDLGAPLILFSSDYLKIIK